MSICCAMRALPRIGYCETRSEGRYDNAKCRPEGTPVTDSVSGVAGERHNRHRKHMDCSPRRQHSVACVGSAAPCPSCLWVLMRLSPPLRCVRPSRQLDRYRRSIATLCFRCSGHSLLYKLHSHPHRPGGGMCSRSEPSAPTAQSQRTPRLLLRVHEILLRVPIARHSVRRKGVTQLLVLLATELHVKGRNILLQILDALSAGNGDHCDTQRLGLLVHPGERNLQSCGRNFALPP